MSMYNLPEYKLNNYDTTASSSFYSKDEATNFTQPTSNNDNGIVKNAIYLSIYLLIYLLLSFMKSFFLPPTIYTYIYMNEKPVCVCVTQ